MKKAEAGGRNSLSRGIVGKRLLGFSAAALLFLGSFYYLITVAFANEDVLAERQEVSSINAVYEVVLKTSKGDFTVSFYNEAPGTKRNFVRLAKSGFYDDTKFHRVVKGFVIQGGDPYTKRSDVSRYGTGDPGYTIKDEISKLPMKRGVVAMANLGEKDSAGSQFFVTVSDRPELEGKYTIFGYISNGMEVVDAINAVPTDLRERPDTPVILESVELRD